MCSITNTAHILSASFSSLASPQPTSSSLSSVLSCLLVVILSCLYVVSRHSLALTDLMLKVACNQGRKVCNSNYVSSLVDTRSDRHVRSRNVSRHSSFLFTKQTKKNPLSNEFLFISPVRYPNRFGF